MRQKAKTELFHTQGSGGEDQRCMVTKKAPTNEASSFVDPQSWKALVRALTLLSEGGLGIWELFSRRIYRVRHKVPSFEEDISIV